jgi:L-ascorbate metabolism protein UlaG (beta-lactamase superfamily)
MSNRFTPYCSHLAIRFFAIAAILTAATETAMGQSRDDTIPTADGAVEIHAIHHASMMLTVKGKHILVDPAPFKGPSNDMAEFKALPAADAILYTHTHYDHYDRDILDAVLTPQTEIVAPQEVADVIPAALRPRVHVMANGDKGTIAGFPLEAMPMHNTTPERMGFHPTGKGNGYILTIGGKRIYIAGDTEEAPELKHLANIDVAFVPVNLPYTMSVDAAAQWIKDFKPRVVYPYHFRNADGSPSNMAALKAAVGPASDVRILKWY